MNPSETECFGYYGYGTGYFGSPDWFCTRCVRADDCWVATRRDPPTLGIEQVAINGEVWQAGQLADGTPDPWTPDPWTMVILANMEAGTTHAKNLTS